MYSNDKIKDNKLNKDELYSNVSIIKKMENISIYEDKKYDNSLKKEALYSNNIASDNKLQNEKIYDNNVADNNNVINPKNLYVNTNIKK